MVSVTQGCLLASLSTLFNRLNPMVSCSLKMFSCGMLEDTHALPRQLLTTLQLQLTLL